MSCLGFDAVTKSYLSYCSNIFNHLRTRHEMLSLIRKISSSQQTRASTPEQAKENAAGDDTMHQSEQQEEDALDVDPRDPERYYTFPHFEDGDERHDPGTTRKEQQRNPGTSNEDDQVSISSAKSSREQGSYTYTTRTTTTATTPTHTPTKTPTSVSPPFWPISPVPKRLRSNTNSSSPPLLHRRATTSQSLSPGLPRVQAPRRSSAQVHSLPSKSPVTKNHSSPAARSLRSITAAASPRVEYKKTVVKSPKQGKESQSPGGQKQKRLSSHSQGSPKRDGGRKFCGG
ncbi:hypothetical protein E4T43_04002 [Aureobasidium subglaciale]|nr:hypothetical protein E4T43_04002 [Aureobasidium subglaciale]